MGSELKEMDLKRAGHVLGRGLKEWDIQQQWETCMESAHWAVGIGKEERW
jgi:hypothetical protein